jgi:hypothetical protein
MDMKNLVVIEKSENGFGASSQDGSLTSRRSF